MNDELKQVVMIICGLLIIPAMAILILGTIWIIKRITKAIDDIGE